MRFGPVSARELAPVGEQSQVRSISTSHYHENFRGIKSATLLFEACSEEKRTLVRSGTFSSFFLRNKIFVAIVQTQLAAPRPPPVPPAPS